MNVKNIIALDIGGTNIKYGCISINGEIISSDKIETEAKKGIDELLKKIYTIINRYLSTNTLGIAISATGQIDFNNGKIIGGNPIIPGWIGCELQKIIEEKFSLPCIVDNDVNCAAVGELWLGSAKNINNFLCLTIGTGIGGGIVFDKKLYRGASSVAGEFGKLFLEAKKETYEKHASMSALEKKVFDVLTYSMNGKEIFDKYWLKDEKISNVVDEWIEDLAEGLRTLLYIWNPSCIVLGGAVTKQGSKLKDRIEKSLASKITNNYLDCLDLKFASLGNDAGMIGATYLLLEKLNKIGGK